MRQMRQEFNAKPRDDHPIDFVDVAGEFIDSHCSDRLRYKADMKTKWITYDINLEKHLPRLVALATLVTLFLLALTGFRF